jgi:hypothetical protein
MRVRKRSQPNDPAFIATRRKSMYKVVIADDEPLVRTGIRNSVAWAIFDGSGSEAENGAKRLT